MENKIKFQEQGNAIVNKEKNKIQDSLSQKTQERRWMVSSKWQNPKSIADYDFIRGKIGSQS